MAHGPQRNSLYVLLGIVVFMGWCGACTVGVRAGLDNVYAMPACEQSCRASHAGTAADIEIRMGKTDHSHCVCTNGARLPSVEGDRVGALSFFAVFLSIVVAMVVVARALAINRGPPPARP